MYDGECIIKPQFFNAYSGYRCGIILAISAHTAPPTASSPVFIPDSL